MLDSLSDRPMPLPVLRVNFYGDTCLLGHQHLNDVQLNYHPHLIAMIIDSSVVVILQQGCAFICKTSWNHPFVSLS